MSNLTYSTSIAQPMDWYIKNLDDLATGLDFVATSGAAITDLTAWGFYFYHQKLNGQAIKLYGIDPGVTSNSYFIKSGFTLIVTGMLYDLLAVAITNQTTRLIADVLTPDTFETPYINITVHGSNY